MPAKGDAKTRRARKTRAKRVTRRAAVAITIGELLSPQVIAALRPSERLAPSRWAQKHISLDRSESAADGPLNHDLAPYLPGIIDMAVKPGVVTLAIQKAAQIGVSAAMRWLLGYYASSDPDPCGVVLPDKEKGRQIIKDRYIGMFEKTPVLEDLLSERKHDTKSEQITLRNGWNLYLMWAHSPSSLASNPMRIGIADEVDKYPSFAGRESHPWYLLEQRLTTYGDRRLQIGVSTPAPGGMICDLFESSHIRLYFLVPCPHCGARQRLIFERVKWESIEGESREEQRKRIATTDGAWYECGACSGKWTSHERNIAVVDGRWGTCDPETWMADGLIDDALAADAYPPESSVGMHISALYCTWKSFGQIADKHLRGLGDFAARMDFYHQTLGERFQTTVKTVDKSVWSERAQSARLPEGVLPWWTARLLLTVDTQRDHFWFVLRAWGAGMRSQRIAHGRCESFDALDELLYRRQWPVEANRYAPFVIDMAAIDSGGTAASDQEAQEGRASRPMEVYRWALDRLAKVRVIKGDTKPRAGVYCRPGQGVYVSESQVTKVPIWLLDTGHYQDELVDLVGQEIESGEIEPTTGELILAPRWELNQHDDETYARHMRNVHKTPVKIGAKVVEQWRPIGPGVRHDLRDCEGYQVALAYMAGTHLLPDLELWRAQREAEAAAHAAAGNAGRQTAPKGWTTPDGRPYMITDRR